MRRAIALAGVALVSACVAPPAPAPPAPPEVTPPAPPPPAPIAPDWRDRPYSAGDWSYAGESGGQARFGPLSLTCDRSVAQVTLVWSGAPAGPLTVRTTSAEVVRQAQAGPDGLVLALPARDALLDQIAFSRGRVMLAAGAQALILPTWPELSRVLEDCR